MAERSKAPPLFRAGCKICGASSTVKSHLLPRALALDARNGSEHLMVGEAHRDGHSFTQAGTFDRTILCAQHEAAIGPFDDYAVRFIRAWRSMVTREIDYGCIISGVDSDLLVRFAAAVIWRHAISDLAPTVQLGGYEPKIRSCIFGGADVSRESSLVLYSFLPDILDHGSLDRMCMPPAAAEADGRRGWGFIIGGLTFVLKTDSRPVVSDRAVLVVNGKGDVACGMRSMRDSPELSGMVKILARMQKPRDGGVRRP